MATVRRISVRSSAKLCTVIGAGAGLLCGMLYAFGGALIDLLVTTGSVTSSETPGLSVGTALAFLALVGMPLIGAVYGLMVGAVSAVLYNIAARLVGGIKVDLQQ